jgi:aminopeptidase YwaD
MKKYLASFLLLVFFVAGAGAQKGQVTPKVDAAQQRLRADIAYLASDKLEGRETGTDGAILAADYIASRFAVLKLKGVSSGIGKPQGAFMEPFPYFSGVNLGTGNFLKLTLPQLSATINLKTNWMPVGFSSNGSLPSTDIVFAGYGIVSDEAKVDDYAGMDVKDKIVLVFSGAPDAGNPHSPFLRFSDVRVKAKIAHDKGAKALLVISGETKLEDDKLAQLKFDQTLGDTAIPAAVIARPVAAMLLGDGSEAELKQDESFIALRKDAEGMKLNLTGRPKASAEVKVDLVKKLAKTYNVIGILEGTDPVLKKEAIIIGAHYDHLGHGGPSSLAVNSTEIHHGADDNASGTAAVMELARRFAAAKNNKRTLIFMCYSGEEEGLLGSKAYTNAPVFPLDKTIAMINMDMVGRLRDQKLSIGGIGTASDWKDLINAKNTALVPSSAFLANNKGEKIDDPPRESPVFALQLNEDGFGPSDHSSFYGKQIPVLFFFTGSHEDYHKPTDTADKINYEGEGRIISYISDIIKSVDQNPVKPSYTVAKSSSMGRSTFNVSLGTVPNYAEGNNDGLLLDGVRDGSPAAKAGIKPGDKIVMLAGKDIRNISDYTYVLGELKAGEEYEIVVMRGAEKITMKIIPAARK